MTTIIGIIGEKLSGKDAAADYFMQRYGAYHARHSHILDEILALLGKEASRRNEIDLAMALRSVFGTGVVGQALMKRVLAVKDIYPLVIMNGIRFAQEFEDVKNLGGKILYVTAPIEVRYERYLKRQVKTDDAMQTFELFKDQEYEPTEIGIAELGKNADYTVKNIGILEEMQKNLDAIAGNLGINKIPTLL